MLSFLPRSFLGTYTLSKRIYRQGPKNCLFRETRMCASKTDGRYKNLICLVVVIFYFIFNKLPPWNKRTIQHWTKKILKYSWWHMSSSTQNQFWGGIIWRRHVAFVVKTAIVLFCPVPHICAKAKIRFKITSRTVCTGEESLEDGMFFSPASRRGWRLFYCGSNVLTADRHNRLFFCPSLPDIVHTAGLCLGRSGKVDWLDLFLLIMSV
jgi:hypothetical protein